MARRRGARITVLAGTNGAGKSSVGGAWIRSKGGRYFNPDELARAIVERDPVITQQTANGIAWHEGVRLLKDAIAHRTDFAFETTLGGATVTDLLRQASGAGLAVEIWYVALRSPELHLARIDSRVKAGGHAIPEADVRRRYDASRTNLISLLPFLDELRIFDNSAEANPQRGVAGKPVLLLHMRRRKIAYLIEHSRMPDWAKPIIAAAIRVAGRR